MDEQPIVDGVTATPQASPPTPPAQEGVPASLKDVSPKLKKRMEFIILVLFGIPYLAFLGWCFFLMSVLPDPTGQYDGLIPIGTATSYAGTAILLLLGLIGLARIAVNKAASPVKRALSFLRIAVVLAPGIALGALAPLIIAKEPRLYMQVVEPTGQQELIAPLPVTFSLEAAVEILQRRGLSPISYGWDFDGDGEKNEDTVVPRATAVYRRSGLYNVVARIRLSNGDERRITFNLPVAKEVFEITPLQPIVDQPVKFSIAHLIDDPEEIEEVQWDFESDGKIDEVTNLPDVVHTFFRVEKVKVSALVSMKNQTQQKHEREFTIVEPEPLPFEVEIVTEPSRLVNPVPFLPVFSIQTDEPIRDVQWSFGDGSEVSGQRVGHTFDKVGDYVVSAQVRSEEGDIARLSTVVRVLDELEIDDLSFDGQPEVGKKNTITGEVPLSVQLTPRTSLSPIDFYWEAPEATSVTSLENTLDVVYRRAGTYNLVLLAQDPEGKAMRVPLTVEVLPPSSNVVILMNPDNGEAPLEVTFDASETTIPNETITGFEWLFGDEDGKDVQAKPGVAVMKHTYKKAGTFDVKLYARTTQGNLYEAMRTIVVRAPLLNACFEASRLTGRAPLGVSFLMECTTGSIERIEWDFGDGTKTDEESPIHVFEKPGTYTVRLNVRDTAGSVSTESIEITAKP